MYRFFLTVACVCAYFCCVAGELTPDILLEVKSKRSDRRAAIVNNAILFVNKINGGKYLIAEANVNDTRALPITPDLTDILRSDFIQTIPKYPFKDTYDKNEPPEQLKEQENNLRVVTLPQKRPDNGQVKRRLDQFAILRKRSYITTVAFQYPVQNAPTLSTETAPINKMTNRHLSDDRHDRYMRSEMSRIVKRQKEALAALQTFLRGRKIKRFKNVKILEEELKKMKNNTETVKSIVITKAGRKKTTLLSVVDETAVREALKMDPLVRRVLQMGNSKRVAYEREVKETEKELKN